MLNAVNGEVCWGSQVDVAIVESCVLINTAQSLNK